MVGNKTKQYLVLSLTLMIIYILFTGLLIDRGKKSQILWDFTGQNRRKIGQFRGNFRGTLGQKAIGKKMADFAVIFRENFARNRSVLR